MAQIDRQQTVLTILRSLRDLGGLKKLFWEELNYERENQPLSMRNWPDSARSALADDPILFASGEEDDQKPSCKDTECEGAMYGRLHKYCETNIWRYQI